MHFSRELNNGIIGFKRHVVNF